MEADELVKSARARLKEAEKRAAIEREKYHIMAPLSWTDASMAH